jgi:hypothetical protein
MAAGQTLRYYNNSYWYLNEFGTWEAVSPAQAHQLIDQGWSVDASQYVPPAGVDPGQPIVDDPNNPGQVTNIPGTPPPPTPAPPAPAAPAPDMSWRNNDQYSVYGRHLGTGSYFQGAGGQPLDTTQQLFYQTDAGRQAGYARFMSEEADPTSYYYRWLGNQQGRVEQDFRNASVADPNLQYTNYVDQQSKGLYDTYRNLPGWQQGMNPGVTWAGRRM